MKLPLSLQSSRPLKLLSAELTQDVLAHPAQRVNVKRIAELITWMRSCDKPGDYYEFQRHLFGDIYLIEERRAQCSRIIKRLRVGKPLPVDAPSPPPYGNANALESWELEGYVYTRLARQLRVVGDGLAWRVFGYDRRMILALSRNSSPGPMYDKDGLPYELGRVEDLWNQKGHFALLHDLTNCLRIADITEFVPDGGPLLHEVKATRREDKEQLRRMQRAVAAINSGGPLPGPRQETRLVELTEPYVTNLRQLDDLIQLAKRHGTRGMKLTQGRAIVATSLVGAAARWNDNPEWGMHAIDSARLRAIERAGIARATHHICGVSADTASRSPIMVPWSIYPFDPQDCAHLICDLVIFEVVLSVDSLAESLQSEGLTVEVFLPQSHGDLIGDTNILRIHLRDRSLTLHPDGLSLLLYELVEPKTWAAGMREVLELSEPPGEPALTFASEADCWV